jgi:hypothetical protein
VRRARIRGLEIAGAGLLVLALGLFLFIFRLQQRGQTAIHESDLAFHRGDLREAVRKAEVAFLAYVPGSEHVSAAEERLVAVARGAEAEKNFALARSAWEALRVAYGRTRYPGRPTPRYWEESDRAVERLDSSLERK